jgi:hypothetical protein
MEKMKVFIFSNLTPKYTQTMKLQGVLRTLLIGTLVLILGYVFFQSFDSFATHALRKP